MNQTPFRPILFLAASLVLARLGGGCAHRHGNEFSAPAAATSASDLYDIPPRPLVTPTPDYPAEAQRRGIEGQTTVAYVVGTDGRAHNVRFLTPLDPLLDAAARQAIDGWRFEPAVKGRRPVNAPVEHPLAFSLGTR